jgi:uncharacterized membrane protein
MIKPLIIAIILSLSPIFELRAGIPLAILSGVPVWMAYLVSCLANLLVFFIVVYFLDWIHETFFKYRWYRRNYNFYISKNRRKIQNKIGTKWEAFFLFLFVAVPLPFTGAYTASVLAWFFDLEKWKAFVPIALGVFVSGILVTLATVGIVRLF